MALAVAAVLAGCGSRAPRPAGLRLERTDLALLAHALQRLESPIGREASGARVAWPQLYRGLPGSAPGKTSAAGTARTTGAASATGGAGATGEPLVAAIATADARAGAIALPTLFTVEGALTGPAAAIGGLLKNYALLTQRGWRFLAAASGARARGAGGASGSGDASGSAGGGAAFLRANSGLYVYCIYDGHFELSVLGKKLQSAYAKLGGAAAFGAALPPSAVEALARAYSPARVRLEPHPAPGVGV
ncbi:MAG TPA: hypothetical protein VK756_09015 [Solirubrobacteraceae bacterium]|nr:hypothetical protein [Solirubrobacteraceae bacterium]